ncbi:MAG: phospho-sugar mutase [Propionicimonas sp.]
MNVVLERARAWVAADPDPRDRAELTALIGVATSGEPAAATDLADRMAGPLTFGTAGLRGAIGAGPNRMNTAVVTTATAGLCRVLREDLGAGFHLVVGYDARHRSDEFARTVAAVAVAAGGRVSLMPGTFPTPVLAYALNALDADAGVMVTASHNPPADNGYKVYLGARMSEPGGAGAQIVPPMDSRIFEAILASGPAADVPVAANGWEPIPEQVIDAYVSAAASLVAGRGAPLKVVLTAMHGVGAATALRTLAAAGFDDVTPVAEQIDPDPDFPTVTFPNPEEPGALDLAMATAAQIGADLIVALDPDADRCSLAVPSGEGWRQLSGDEIGALLGEQAAAEHQGDADATLARSIVSSSLLGRIAVAHGLRGTETLTGFKWISRAPGLVFGYEEAIGYCVNPTAVRDKDGISAAVKACELAATLKAAGRTLEDQLAELAVRHGLHATSPLSFRVADLSLIGRALERLRADPPAALAGAAVISYDDLVQGYRGLPPTDGVRIATDAGDRVIVRPSGTEPKLKCYLEVVAPVDSVAELPQVREAAAQRLDQIKGELRSVLGL